MRVNQVFLVIVGIFLLPLSACQTIVPTPTLPSGQLGELFELKNKAVTDGKQLKENMGEHREKSMGESLKEMIGVGDDSKTNLAEGRDRYDQVASAYNAAIEMIQENIMIGKNPADYVGDLDLQIQQVREKQELLANFTMQKLGRSRGIEDVLESNEAQALVKAVNKIWQARKEEVSRARQEARDALNDKKMVSFAEL